MSTVMSAIVVLALAASFAAALVFAAKWQETRQKIWDERSVWLTEIKKIEHDKEILLEGGRKDAETIQWYTEQLCTEEQEAESLRMRVDYLEQREEDLQNRLSLILCPRNDHVWVDGCCVKCGRMQDGQD